VDPATEADGGTDVGPGQGSATMRAKGGLFHQLTSQGSGAKRRRCLTLAQS
jgi:hypothetical protein